MALLCSKPFKRSPNDPLSPPSAQRDYVIFLLSLKFMTSPMLSPASFCYSSTCSLLFLEHNRHDPASGPLYILFSLPGMFSQDACIAYSLTTFLSLLKYHLLQPSKNCTPTCTVPFFALFFSLAHITTIIFSFLYLSLPSPLEHKLHEAGLQFAAEPSRTTAVLPCIRGEIIC